MISYIRDHAKYIIWAMVMSALFIVVFYLYNLPLPAVGYAVLLGAVITIILIIIDFIKYYKKHIALFKMTASIRYGIDEMPETSLLLETDYQKLLRLVDEEKMSIITSTDNAITDMVDYYTIWTHQIKTPIAAMRLLIQSGSATENELSSELFKIEQYAKMALYYIRLESESSDYIFKTYNLDNIVREAIRRYSRIFIGKNITLEYNIDSVSILTDEKWFLFVVEQLISNALKYTNSGKIKIYVLDENTLVIEDTGIGIPESDLPRICEKGFTGYNGRKDKTSTGIGLYLCKRILNKLSHTIRIESEVDIGTKVMINFKMSEMNPE